jgi:hypothetical protein
MIEAHHEVRPWHSSENEFNGIRIIVIDSASTMGRNNGDGWNANIWVVETEICGERREAFNTRIVHSPVAIDDVPNRNTTQLLPRSNFKLSVSVFTRCDGTTMYLVSPVRAVQQIYD